MIKKRFRPLRGFGIEEYTMMIAFIVLVIFFYFKSKI